MTPVPAPAANGRLGLAGIICAGILFALAALATNQVAMEGPPLVWLIGGAFLFNLVSIGVAWLVTRSSRRLLILGRYPFVLGAAKLAAFVAIFLLLVLIPIAAIGGREFGEFAFRAFVRGLIAGVALSLFASGLLNTLIVVRHVRGTLATTSKVLDQQT